MESAPEKVLSFRVENRYREPLAWILMIAVIREQTGFLASDSRSSKENVTWCHSHHTENNGAAETQGQECDALKKALVLERTLKLRCVPCACAALVAM